MKLYDELKTKIGRKTIAHATSVHWGEEKAPIVVNGRSETEDQREVLCVKFHATDIVKLYPDGSVRLDSGGWRVPITRERIREYSKINIQQIEGLWFVYRNSKTDLTPYYDGMLFDAKGRPTAPRAESAGDLLRRKHALDRAVRQYIKDFQEHLRRQVQEKGSLNPPSEGDCWHCAFFGDSDVGHLVSHMIEGYYVPSLLFNAFKERRGGTSWQSGRPTQEDVLKGASFDWHYAARELGDNRNSWMVDLALRRYFSKRKWRLLEVFDPKRFKKDRADHITEKKSE